MVNNRISLPGPRGALTVEREEKKPGICSQAKSQHRPYHPKSPESRQVWLSPGPGIGQVVQQDLDHS